MQINVWKYLKEVWEIPNIGVCVCVCGQSSWLER